MTVGHFVGEYVAQRLAGAKSINGDVGVVDRVAIATVRPQHQSAEIAGHAGWAARQGAARNDRGRWGTVPCADAGQRKAVPGIHVAVIGQQVAARVEARNGVGGTACFACRSSVSNCHGCIVCTLQSDGQPRNVGFGAVTDAVEEGVGQRLAKRQSIHCRVRVSWRVNVSAIGQQRKGAVLAGHAQACGARRCLGPRLRNTPGAIPYITGGVAADHSAISCKTLLNCNTARVLSVRLSVVGGAFDADGQRRGAAGAGSVLHAIGKGIAGGRTRGQTHIGKGVGVAAVAAEQQVTSRPG